MSLSPIEKFNDTSLINEKQLNDGFNSSSKNVPPQSPLNDSPPPPMNFSPPPPINAPPQLPINVPPPPPINGLPTPPINGPSPPPINGPPPPPINCPLPINGPPPPPINGLGVSIAPLSIDEDLRARCAEVYREPQLPEHPPLLLQPPPRLTLDQNRAKNPEGPKMFMKKQL